MHWWSAQPVEKRLCKIPPCKKWLGGNLAQNCTWCKQWRNLWAGIKESEEMSSFETTCLCVKRKDANFSKRNWNAMLDSATKSDENKSRFCTVCTCRFCLEGMQPICHDTHDPMMLRLGKTMRQALWVKYHVSLRLWGKENIVYKVYHAHHCSEIMQTKDNDHQKKPMAKSTCEAAFIETLGMILCHIMVRCKSIKVLLLMINSVLLYLLQYASATWSTFVAWNIHKSQTHSLHGRTNCVASSCPITWPCGSGCWRSQPASYVNDIRGETTAKRCKLW